MRFIKLTSMIINTNHITHIVTNPNKYHIYMIPYNCNGFIMFGSGIMSTTKDELEICANKYPDDYKIVSEWIARL